MALLLLLLLPPWSPLLSNVQAGMFLALLSVVYSALRAGSNTALFAFGDAGGESSEAGEAMENLLESGEGGGLTSAGLDGEVGASKPTAAAGTIHPFFGGGFEGFFYPNQSSKPSPPFGLVYYDLCPDIPDRQAQEGREGGGLSLTWLRGRGQQAHCRCRHWCLLCSTEKLCVSGHLWLVQNAVIGMVVRLRGRDMGKLELAERRSH